MTRYVCPRCRQQGHGSPTCGGCGALTVAVQMDPLDGSFARWARQYAATASDPGRADRIHRGVEAACGYVSNRNGGAS